MHVLRPLIASVALAALLSACGKDTPGPAGRSGNDDEAALPAPEGARGSVTGMPDKPGPGKIGLPPQPVAEVQFDEAGNPILPTAEGALPVTEPGVAPEAAVDTTAAGVAEPTAQDAVAVVRDYYAAINRRDFARAYALWSDGGRATNQSPQQFADGFGDTAGVSVEILAPGEVDAAAGSRYIEVPVALTATHADGSQHKFVGAYTLRRAVVDGATPEQRAWRIGTADLREVMP